ncbi:pleckstrin homology domain-containing family A member 5 isoform X26 [Pipistrellus kuhlii]|uniref:pleckstrin homology domain-containing family A member 5 isoform X26 n=1 Tax=Pipistrellus kuhlii TaxID=59472 RepID=UPI001E270658|nr:pleckstrin homology domain-containing family A member 5 isoform X26 [Pipistrellus kuhlii]
MAADLNLEWVCSLPRSWTYGITRGGRVFFINEEAKSTTWLHPVTGEAVVTGHRRQSTDLPTGWEEAYTFEGARYYINPRTTAQDQACWCPLLGIKSLMPRIFSLPLSRPCPW